MSIKHIRECAEESGVDLEALTALSAKKNHTWKGEKFESFYREESCSWEAFKKGIGTVYGPRGRHEAVEAMREKIDAETS